MPFRIRPVRQSRSSTVVFTARDDEVSAIDVAIGPCLERVGPRGGLVRPIVSPLDQHPDRIDHLERLFEILVPMERGDLIVERVEVKPGTLVTLSPGFANALREVNVLADEVQRAWLDAIDWPTGQQIGGLTMRLLDYSSKAVTAFHRGQPLYCWSGPELPFLAIASGQTPRDYEEYRRSKSRA